MKLDFEYGQGTMAAELPDNTDVFIFGEPSIRKVLADIQIEEQNHAEMLWKYKEVNCMQ